MSKPIPFDRKLAEQALAYFIITSENESELFVKERVRRFCDEPRSDVEVYDFLASIAAMRVDRIPAPPGAPYNHICVGYISGFAQVLCEIASTDRVRPESSPAQQIDLERVATEFKRAAKWRASMAGRVLAYLKLCCRIVWETVRHPFATSVIPAEAAP